MSVDAVVLKNKDKLEVNLLMHGTIEENPQLKKRFEQTLLKLDL